MEELSARMMYTMVCHYNRHVPPTLMEGYKKPLRYTLGAQMPTPAFPPHTHSKQGPTLLQEVVEEAIKIIAEEDEPDLPEGVIHPWMGPCILGPVPGHGKMSEENLGKAMDYMVFRGFRNDIAKGWGKWAYPEFLFTHSGGTLGIYYSFVEEWNTVADFVASTTDKDAKLAIGMVTISETENCTQSEPNYKMTAYIAASCKGTNALISKVVARDKGDGPLNLAEKGIQALRELAPTKQAPTPHAVFVRVTNPKKSK